MTRDKQTLKKTNVKKIEDLVRDYGIPVTGLKVETPMATGFVPTINAHTTGMGRDTLGSGIP